MDNKGVILKDVNVEKSKPKRAGNCGLHRMYQKYYSHMTLIGTSCINIRVGRGFLETTKCSSSIFFLKMARSASCLWTI